MILGELWSLDIILASAFKEIMTCCDLNIGNKTVRMTGDLAAALRGGLFSHTCFLSFPQLPQARGGSSIPDRARREPERSSREEMLFYPETLHIRKVVLCVRSLDVGCWDLLGAIASHQPPPCTHTEVH